MGAAFKRVRSVNAISPLPVDRRADRTQMFLVATLYFGGATTAVRVRNMSESGALVEGANLPSRGSPIIMRRGALEVEGRAVWSSTGKAGLTFDQPLTVSAWLPTREAKRQTQIDEVAFALKHAARAVDHALAPARDDDRSLAMAIADLGALQAQLGRLGDQLALDGDLLVKHPEVQLLDVAGQRIGRIIATLRNLDA